MNIYPSMQHSLFQWNNTSREQAWVFTLTTPLQFYIYELEMIVTIA